MLWQLDKAAAVFGGSMIRDSKAFRRFAGSLKLGQVRICCAWKKCCRRGQLEATWVGGTNRGHTVDDGSRMSGAIGWMLWSEERLVATLTTTPRSGVRTGAGRIPVSGRLHGQHTLSLTTILW